MKTKSARAGYLRPLGILAAVIFSSVTAQANPIELPEKSITPEVSLVIGGARTGHGSLCFGWRECT
jgi:hypothetical protein